MTPNVPIREEVRPVTEPPLSAMLILPISAPSRKRSIWSDFLRDMSYLLPGFGLLLGVLLAMGQAVFGGISLLLVSLAAFSIRLHFTFASRRARQRLEAFEKMYRDHRDEVEQQWRRQLSQES